MFPSFITQHHISFRSMMALSMLLSHQLYFNLNFGKVRVLYIRNLSLGICTRFCFECRAYLLFRLRSEIEIGAMIRPTLEKLRDFCCITYYKENEAHS